MVFALKLSLFAVYLIYIKTIQVDAWHNELTPKKRVYFITLICENFMKSIKLLVVLVIAMVSLTACGDVAGPSRPAATQNSK